MLQGFPNVGSIFSFKPSLVICQREGFSPHSCPSSSSSCCYWLFMLVWLVVWGGEHCLFSIDLNLSQELCAPVQPSGTGLGSECRPAHPTPPREQRWASAVVSFSQLHLFSQQCPQSTRFIALPLGVLGERGEKFPDGALCCSHGGCWCLLQAYIDWEGAFSGFSPHPFLSFCEHQIRQGNRPMYI